MHRSVRRLCSTTSVETILRKGAEEARNRLPELQAAAEKGRSTIITRHGRPVAVLAPIAAHGAAAEQQPLTLRRGSGRGLWEKTAPALFTVCATNEAARFGDLPEEA